MAPETISLLKSKARDHSYPGPAISHPAGRIPKGGIPQSPIQNLFKSHIKVDRVPAVGVKERLVDNTVNGELQR